MFDLPSTKPKCHILVFRPTPAPVNQSAIVNRQSEIENKLWPGGNI